jgi:hypothetical protein
MPQRTGVQNTEQQRTSAFERELKELLKKPTIIYSEKCKHSSVFLEGLSKHNTLYKNFVKINIDAVHNRQTNKFERPNIFYNIQNLLGTRIQKVPTIIVEQGEYVLTDKDAFKWLEYNLVKDRDTITGFSQAEMSLFSDKYADFGSTTINMMDDEHVKHQNFVFVKETVEKIQTPRDDDLYIRNEDTITGQRTQIDNAMESQQKNMGKLDLSDKYVQEGYTQEDVYQLDQNRRLEAEPKRTIDFQNPNLGYAGQTMPIGEAKKSDLDNKFEQMQMQRESFGDSPSSGGPPSGSKVDFNTGQVLYDK